MQSHSPPSDIDHLTDVHVGLSEVDQARELPNGDCSDAVADLGPADQSPIKKLKSVMVGAQVTNRSSKALSPTRSNKVIVKDNTLKIAADPTGVRPVLPQSNAGSITASAAGRGSIARSATGRPDASKPSIADGQPIAEVSHVVSAITGSAPAKARPQKSQVTVAETASGDAGYALPVNLSSPELYEILRLRIIQGHDLPVNFRQDMLTRDAQKKIKKVLSAAVQKGDVGKQWSKIWSTALGLVPRTSRRRCLEDTTESEAMTEAPAKGMALARSTAPGKKGKVVAPVPSASPSKLIQRNQKNQKLQSYFTSTVIQVPHQYNPDQQPYGQFAMAQLPVMQSQMGGVNVRARPFATSNDQPPMVNQSAIGPNYQARQTWITGQICQTGQPPVSSQPIDNPKVSSPKKSASRPRAGQPTRGATSQMPSTHGDLEFELDKVIHYDSKAPLSANPELMNAVFQGATGHKLPVRPDLIELGLDQRLLFGQEHEHHPHVDKGGSKGSHQDREQDQDLASEVIDGLSESQIQRRKEEQHLAGLSQLVRLMQQQGSLQTQLSDLLGHINQICIVEQNPIRLQDLQKLFQWGVSDPQSQRMVDQFMARSLIVLQGVVLTQIQMNNQTLPEQYPMTAIGLYILMIWVYPYKQGILTQWKDIWSSMARQEPIKRAMSDLIQRQFPWKPITAVFMELLHGLAYEKAPDGQLLITKPYQPVNLLEFLNRVNEALEREDPEDPKWAHLPQILSLFVWAPADSFEPAGLLWAIKEFMMAENTLAKLLHFINHDLYDWYLPAINYRLSKQNRNWLSNAINFIHPQFYNELLLEQDKGRHEDLESALMLQSNMGVVALLDEQERVERLRLLDDQQNEANEAAIVDNLDIFSEEPTEESIHTEHTEYEPEDDSNYGGTAYVVVSEQDRQADWDQRRLAAATKRQAQQNLRAAWEYRCIVTTRQRECLVEIYQSCPHNLRVRQDQVLVCIKLYKALVEGIRYNRVIYTIGGPEDYSPNDHYCGSESEKGCSQSDALIQHRGGPRLAKRALPQPGPSSRTAPALVAPGPLKRQRVREDESQQGQFAADQKGEGQMPKPFNLTPDGIVAPGGLDSIAERAIDAVDRTVMFGQHHPVPELRSSLIDDEQDQIKEIKEQPDPQSTPNHENEKERDMHLGVPLGQSKKAMTYQTMHLRSTPEGPVDGSPERRNTTMIVQELRCGFGKSTVFVLLALMFSERLLIDLPSLPQLKVFLCVPNEFLHQQMSIQFPRAHLQARVAKADRTVKGTFLITFDELCQGIPEDVLKDSILLVDEADQVMFNHRFHLRLQKPLAVIGLSATMGGDLGFKKLQFFYGTNCNLQQVGVQNVEFDLNKVHMMRYQFNDDKRLVVHKQEAVNSLLDFIQTRTPLLDENDMPVLTEHANPQVCQAGRRMPVLILGGEKALTNYRKVLERTLTQRGILYYHFQPADTIRAQTQVDRCFRAATGAVNVVIADTNECIGVNFFKRCFVVMISMPENLAVLHQSFGRSNRVEHDGFMHVALPIREGEPDDLGVMYEALHSAFLSSRTCPFCGHKSRNRKGAEAHSRICVWKPFTCPLSCGAGPYAKEEWLRDHIRKKHPELTESVNKRLIAKERTRLARQEAQIQRLAARQVKETTVYAVDTETTHTGKHEVAECCQIAIVRVDCLTAGEHNMPHCQSVFTMKFRPRGPIWPEATSIHGMTKQSLASEVRFNRSHAEHIMSYLGNCKLIVGHNVKFDIDRLSEQFIRVGAVDQADWLRRQATACTQALAVQAGLSDSKAGFPKLDSLASMLLGQSRVGRYHDAEWDAHMSARIWVRLLKTSR